MLLPDIVREITKGHARQCLKPFLRPSPVRALSFCFNSLPKRHHQEDLQRFRQSFEIARNILGPVLRGAQSQLGLGIRAGVGRFRFASTARPPRHADTPQQQGQHRHQQVLRSQMQSHQVWDADSEACQENSEAIRRDGIGSRQPRELGGRGAGEVSESRQSDWTNYYQESCDCCQRRVRSSGRGRQKHQRFVAHCP